MSDFSSDKILESYRMLNEISWRDADVCPMCGMCYSEVGDDCAIEACPSINEIKEDDED